MFSKLNTIKLFTLIVRISGIGARFLLTFFITKNISLQFQGEYTLISTTVTLLVIFFGLDFYVYANRLIVKKSDSEIYNLKNSLTFYSFFYLLTLPFFYVAYKIFNVDIVPFWVLFLLIIFEHLGQEFFRYYIALKKPLLANILLFIRTGLWCLILDIGFLTLTPFKISLINIVSLWLVCAFLSCFCGFYFYPNITEFFKQKIDLRWIKKGVLVGLAMFLSTICLKIIEFSDRYLIAFFLDKKELGIYSLYFQITNVVNVMIFTMYVSFVYPDIIKGVHMKQVDELNKAKNTIFSKTFVIVGIYTVGSFAFLPLFLNYINREELYDKILIFYILIISTLFSNLSFYSHFVLVGAEKEKMILKATLIACVLNITLNFLLVPTIGVYGAAISLLFSNFMLFIIKRRFEKKMISEWW
ncbi:polysaccharide biosynthesis C-terminal domain-containing protein [Aquimarina sp. W85]|uniref:oligosaccharide flippase family protein n=1 Tax=Aquimarina rhodophyticola TaxID=3342246 RepID=UPI00367002F6